MAQRVVQREVERHHLAPFPGDGEALLAPDPQLHVLGAELDRASGQVDA